MSTQSRKQKTKLRRYMRRNGIEFPKCQIEGCDKQSLMFKPDFLDKTEVLFLCRSHLNSYNLKKPLIEGEKTRIQEKVENLTPYDVRDMESNQASVLEYTPEHYRNEAKRKLAEKDINIKNVECLAEGCHRKARLSIKDFQNPSEISLLCRSHSAKPNYDPQKFDVNSDQDLEELQSKLQAFSKIENTENQKETINIGVEQEDMQDQKPDNKFPQLPNGKFDLSQMDLHKYTFQEIQQYPRGKYSSENIDDPILKQQQERALEDKLNKKEQTLDIGGE